MSKELESGSEPWQDRAREIEGSFTKYADLLRDPFQLRLTMIYVVHLLCLKYITSSEQHNIKSHALLGGERYLLIIRSD